MGEQETAPQAPAPAARAALWRFAPLVLIAAALGTVFLFDLDRFFTLDALKENRAALQGFVAEYGALAVAGFIALYAAAVAISLPGAAILTIVGGFLFGLWGTAANALGATIGATIIFLIARTSLGETLRARAGGFVKRFEAGFREGEFTYLLILRLVPLFPFWVVNVVPAFLGARLRNFVIATAIGILPGTFVYTSIGNAAGAVFDAGGELELTGVMTQPEVLIPIAGLIALALIPLLYKRFKAKPAPVKEA